MNFFRRTAIIWKGLAPGKQRIDVGYSGYWQNCQQKLQIAMRVQAILLGSLNDGIQYRAGLGTVRSVGEQPRLAAHHKGLYRALGPVVSNFSTAIGKHILKILLLGQRITNRFA